MRIARVRVGGRVSTAVVKGRTVHLVRGTPFGRLDETGESYPLSKVALLAPVQPGKVVAIGLNYRSHVESSPVAHGEPEHPEPFLKAATSVIGPGAAIVIPHDAGRVDEEGEVVAVIGRRCRNLTEAEVDAHVLGYTAGNDVSARDLAEGRPAVVAGQVGRHVHRRRSVDRDRPRSRTPVAHRAAER